MSRAVAVPKARIQVIPPAKRVNPVTRMKEARPVARRPEPAVAQEKRTVRRKRRVVEEEWEEIVDTRQPMQAVTNDEPVASVIARTFSVLFSCVITLIVFAVGAFMVSKGAIVGSLLIFSVAGILAMATIGLANYRHG